MADGAFKASSREILIVCGWGSVARGSADVFAEVLTEELVTVFVCEVLMEFVV